MKGPLSFAFLSLFFAYLTVVGIIKGLQLTSLYGSTPGILGFVYGLSALATAIGLWLFRPWAFHATIVFSISVLLWLFNWQYGLDGRYTLPLHYFVAYVLFVCLLLIILVFYVKKKLRDAQLNG